MAKKKFLKCCSNRSQLNRLIELFREMELSFRVSKEPGEEVVCVSLMELDTDYGYSFYFDTKGRHIQ